MEKYTIIGTPDDKGIVAVKRASDGMVSRCKAGWLKLVSGETYQAKSKTKAIRLDGLEWTTTEV